MSNKVRTALSMISALQRYYYIKGVMFTNSSFVRRECKELGIDVIPIYHHNRFGMPYLRHLLLTIRSLYDSRSYGYMNSDIVLSEVLIHTLPALLNHIADLDIQVSYYHHFPTSKIEFLTFRLKCLVVYITLTMKHCISIQRFH